MRSSCRPLYLDAKYSLPYNTFLVVAHIHKLRRIKATVPCQRLLPKDLTPQHDRLSRNWDHDFQSLPIFQPVSTVKCDAAAAEIHRLYAAPPFHPPLNRVDKASNWTGTRKFL